MTPSFLDLGLPDRDGFDVCRDVRARSTVPIIVVTARSEEVDRVVGLELGADDYIVKPFSPAELVARVDAVMRRVDPAPEHEAPLVFEGIEIDPLARQVTVAGEEISLTQREFELLEYLLRHLGHVVSREMLAHDVWREPRRATPIDNVIDVQMARLRKKVDVEGDDRLIHTVRGVGFVLREGEP